MPNRRPSREPASRARRGTVTTRLPATAAASGALSQSCGGDVEHLAGHAPPGRRQRSPDRLKPADGVGFVQPLHGLAHAPYGRYGQAVALHRPGHPGIGVRAEHGRQAHYGPVAVFLGAYGLRQQLVASVGAFVVGAGGVVLVQGQGVVRPGAVNGGRGHQHDGAGTGAQDVAGAVHVHFGHRRQAAGAPALPDLGGQVVEDVDPLQRPAGSRGHGRRRTRAPSGRRAAR